MAWSLLNAMLAEDVKKIMDRPEFRQDPDSDRFFSRDKAEAIIHAALWGYSSRESGTAGCYAFRNLMDALGIKQWTFDQNEADAFQAVRQSRMRQAFEQK